MCFSHVAKFAKTTWRWILWGMSSPGLHRWFFWRIIIWRGEKYWSVGQVCNLFHAHKLSYCAFTNVLKTQKICANKHHLICCWQNRQQYRIQGDWIQQNQRRGCMDWKKSPSQFWQAWRFLWRCYSSWWRRTKSWSSSVSRWFWRWWWSMAWCRWSVKYFVGSGGNNIWVCSWTNCWNRSTFACMHA